LTVFAGGVLAFVGASLQGLLENPLVDPYIIGSSSGAGVGVALALLFGWTSVFGRPLFAFAGAVAALVLVYAIASARGRATRLSLILSGVAVSFVCSSLVMVLMVLSRSELSQIIYLLMGSTNILFTPQELWTFIISASLSVAGAAWIFARWRSLDILSSNIETAETLGVNTRRLTSEVFIISALLVGIVVAYAGAVSFVGLIVPHIVRFLFGPRHLRVLPASVLVGASLLLASDLVLRLFSMATNVYLPLSVVTTLVGVPFFLFIMKRRLNV
jgi:iron complex transport system permease protein